jgi:hypothetical protein
MSERLAKEGSRMVARRRATKREVPMQFRVVGVDEKCSRGRGDDVGGEVVMDEDVEGGETGRDLEGSCWTPRLSQG